jgi:NADH-quinone oxidoreductase subunit L
MFLFATGSPINPPHLGPFTWISTAGFTASFGLQADALSMIMLLMITGVSTLIHVYSIGYMNNDEGFNRFFSYLNLFVFFMLLLVTADNYMLVFAGWEGVGLCSYLLIGFWFRNPEYAKAANKAYIMNRIGDLGFLLAIATLFLSLGTLNFSEIGLKIARTETMMPATLIAFFLLTGAVGKSAQFPLYTWLPDAMAGPTPVSALIHAATMVTAGVYLVIRSKVIFLLAPLAMTAVMGLGIFTALLAASIALKQNDIKKILAYSTVSQLGLMFFGLGLGAFDSSLFHLITHAFFKALLFLGAGSVIHALHGEQDIRRMGGLRGKTRLTWITMVIGALAISGIPPFAGFFSKDALLAAAMEKSFYLWILALGVSLMTAYYMFRLLFLVFYGTFRGEQHAWDKAHESPGVMSLPLIVLAILSVTGGFLNVPALFGGHEWLAGFTDLAGEHEGHAPLTEWLTIVVTVALVAGVIYIVAKVVSKGPTQEAVTGFGKLLTARYHVDEIYDMLIVKPLTRLSESLHRVMEIRVVDAAVEGVGAAVIALSRVFRLLQSGSVSFYLLFMVVGIILILFLNLFI